MPNGKLPSVMTKNKPKKLTKKDAKGLVKISDAFKLQQSKKSKKRVFVDAVGAKEARSIAVDLAKEPHSIVDLAEQSQSIFDIAEKSQSIIDLTEKSQPIVDLAEESRSIAVDLAEESQSIAVDLEEIDATESAFDDMLKKQAERANNEKEFTDALQMEVALIEKDGNCDALLKQILNGDSLHNCFNYGVVLSNGRLEYNGRSSNYDKHYRRKLEHMLRMRLKAIGKDLGRNMNQEVYGSVVDFLREDPKNNWFKIVVLAEGQSFIESVNFESALIEENDIRTPGNSNVARGNYLGDLHGDTALQRKVREQVYKIAVQKLEDDQTRVYYLNGLMAGDFTHKLYTEHALLYGKKTCSHETCERDAGSSHYFCWEHRKKEKTCIGLVDGELCNRPTDGSHDFCWEHILNKRCRIMVNGSFCGKPSGVNNRCPEHVAEQENNRSPEKSKRPVKACIGLTTDGELCEREINDGHNHCWAHRERPKCVKIINGEQCKNKRGSGEYCSEHKNMKDCRECEKESGYFNFCSDHKELRGKQR